MGKYIELNNDNFDATVGQGVSLVDFWAPWCGPCRMIAPVIEELAEDFDGTAKICKVNTDEQQELAVKYEVRSIPTIVFLKDGSVRVYENADTNKDDSNFHKKCVEVYKEWCEIVKHQGKRESLLYYPPTEKLFLDIWAYLDNQTKTKIS